ncbi:MAG: TerC family protein [candidate division Zixibacteria bacterium]|nr:TerC family protein [candidate division Zixibacteria bacterium]
MLTNKYVIWGGFNLLVLAMLALDLGIFHRKDHKITAKEGLIWSAIWIAVSLCFNVVIYFWLGEAKALQFFTGYLIEKSLSIDNIFVFLLIFTYFGVPDKYQYKVLFWGIIGALLMRGIFIGVGALLIAKFHWIIYVFGAFLVYTGIKMGVSGDSKVDPDKNPILKLVRRFIPLTKNYRNGHFFVKEGGKKFGTPLFVVLIVIETTDVVFAVDSIPAIFAITLDPFIVYSSNVFAILGLRALYFALAGLMDMFYYLKYGLSAILSFVGVKMLLSAFYKIPDMMALGIIAFLLAISIIISIIKPHKKDNL